MAENLDEIYDTIHALVLKCGEIVKNAADNPQFETKSCEVDLVTATDKLVEDTLIGELKAKYPKHCFIGEETVSANGKCYFTEAPTWIIDPIDGTMNFVHGFPHSSISVAFYINKEAEIALVYNPHINQLFTARKNQGSFLNGKQIFVSKQTELRNSLLMVEAGTDRDVEKMKVVLNNICHLTPKVHGIRALGSCALNMAMVAMGVADACYEYGIHAWDTAAGVLLVKEAGGVFVDPAGGKFDLMSRRMLVASNEKLAKELSENLIQYYPVRDDFE